MLGAGHQPHRIDPRAGGLDAQETLAGVGGGVIGQRAVGVPDHRRVAALLGDAQASRAIVENRLAVGLVDAIDRPADAQLALLDVLGEALELIEIACAGQALDTALVRMRNNFYLPLLLTKRKNICLFHLVYMNL